MKRKLIWISLIFIGILFSCEKEKQLFPEYTDNLLLSRITVDSVPLTIYSYNGANLLTEEKTSWYYTKYNYNNDNQLISEDEYLDRGIYSSSLQEAIASHNRTEWVNPDNTERFGYKTYEYNDNGQLSRSTRYQWNQTTSSDSRYVYDGNNRITKVIFYTGNNVSGYINYLYDGRDNIIKSSLYYVLEAGVEQLVTITEYEFDNKRNPYLAFEKLMIPGVNTNRNNIIKETYSIYFDVGPSVQRVQVTATSYEYNENGYPKMKNGYYEYEYIEPTP